jgi:SHS2 domain-containing protein
VSSAFEELDHTADWALRLQGKDMAELCLHAASAMLAACGARAAPGETTERRVSLQAGDREALLVRWLEEVLYTIDVNHRLPVRFAIEVSPNLELSARWQEAELVGIDKPIKAVTYNGLAVKETEGRLEATVVFDV